MSNIILKLMMVSIFSKTNKFLSEVSFGENNYGH